MPAAALHRRCPPGLRCHLQEKKKESKEEVPARRPPTARRPAPRLRLGRLREHVEAEDQPNVAHSQLACQDQGPAQRRLLAWVLQQAGAAQLV